MIPQLLPPQHQDEHTTPDQSEAKRRRRPRPAHSVRVPANPASRAGENIPRYPQIFPSTLEYPSVSFYLLRLAWPITLLPAGDPAMGERMLKWFAYDHLPPELQAVSQPYGMMAETLVQQLTPGPERTVALRKLLESKDAAVRAAVMPGG